MFRRRAGTSPADRRGRWPYRPAYRHHVERPGSRNGVSADSLRIPGSRSRTDHRGSGRHRHHRLGAAARRGRDRCPWAGPRLPPVREKLIRVAAGKAAELLEAAVEDIRFEAGRYHIAGTDRGLSFAEVAFRVAPQGGGPAFDESDEFAPGQATYPNGVHVVEVRNRPRHRRARSRPLYRGRRFRAGDQSRPVAWPGPRRHRPGPRPGIA